MHDLIITGPPRTGTKTLWIFLGSHPQVCRSRFKEPLLEIPDKDYSQEYFSKYFYPGQQTKYFLDTVPLSQGLYLERIKTLESLNMFKKIRYLTFLRDHLERALSLAKWLVSLYSRGLHSKMPPFVDTHGQIDRELFTDWMIQQIKVPYLNLVSVDEQIRRSQILISELKNIETKFHIILSLLKLEPYNIKVRKTNKTKERVLTLEYLKHKLRMDEICDENKELFSELSKEYYNKIVSEYEVI